VLFAPRSTRAVRSGHPAHFGRGVRSARLTPVAGGAAAMAVVAVLAGCAGSGPGSVATPSSSTSTSPEASYEVPDGLVPGSTHAPTELDLSGDIAEGLTFSVVAADDLPDATAETAADIEAALAEFEAFAALHGATVSVVPTGAPSPVDPDSVLVAAADEKPDVVVVLGEGMLSALDRVSASNLAQPFLVVGSQLPEPTANVTAVVWAGAADRGSDGIAPVLAARATEALEAGVAAFTNDVNGIVLALP
jgi:hypothetical protein